MSGRPRFLNHTPAGFTPLVKVDSRHGGELGAASQDLGGNPAGPSGPPGTLERLAAMQARAASNLPLRRDDDSDWPTEEDEMAANQQRAKAHEDNQRERRRLGMELLQQWGPDLPAQEAQDKLRARDIEVTLATVYGWRSLLFGKGKASQNGRAESNGHTSPPVERKDPPHEAPPAPRIIKLNARTARTKTRVSDGEDQLTDLIDLLQSVQRLGGIAVVKKKLKILEELSQ